MSTSPAMSTSATRRGVTEQAAVAAIDSGTRVLRLPTIRGRFEDVAAAAQREQLSYLGFLAELVMAECDDRDGRRAARRIHDAGFPRDKRIGSSTSMRTPRSTRRSFTSSRPAHGSKPAILSA
jgi:IstB-like ATP binding protein